VSEHHVKGLLSEQSQGFLAIGSNGYLIPFAFQHLLEQITVQFFVIDDQNAFRSDSTFPLPTDDGAHLPSVRGVKILTLFWLHKVMEIHLRPRAATNFLRSAPHPTYWYDISQGSMMGSALLGTAPPWLPYSVVWRLAQLVKDSVVIDFAYVTGSDALQRFCRANEQGPGRMEMLGQTLEELRAVGLA